MELTSEQKQWSRILQLVLIEIRALEDHNLPRARDLANVMHNVPTALFGKPENWAREKAALLARAEHVGLGDYLNGLIAHCAPDGVGSAS